MNEIMDKLIELQQSENWLKLGKFYNTSTIYNKLKISRDEKIHSRFIASVFNPKEEHNIAYFAVKKLLLLCMLVKRDYQKNNSLSDFDINYNEIVLENYDIANLEVINEKPIEDKTIKFLDIFIQFTLVYKGLNKKVAIVIENKVKSTENRDIKNNINQTDIYYHK